MSEVSREEKIVALTTRIKLVAAKARLDRSTRRELVGELAQHGMSNSAIATILGISSTTAGKVLRELRDRAKDSGDEFVLPESITGVDGKHYAREVLPQRVLAEAG